MNNFLEVDWRTIPAPVDDGAAKHLTGMSLPSVSLTATNGKVVELSALSGLIVIYAYPMTGKPGTPLPKGWDSLPGARGCTPQSCAFRDHANELRELGVDAVYGVSTQSTFDQNEAVERLHLPFQLLSDESLALCEAMRLPTFVVDGMTMIKRLTLILRQGRVEHVFYPVFPPDKNARMVVDWLNERSGKTI